MLLGGAAGLSPTTAPSHGRQEFTRMGETVHAFGGAGTCAASETLGLGDELDLGVLPEQLASATTARTAAAFLMDLARSHDGRDEVGT